ncbi:adaptor protein MecA [Falsibacillus pallidus]|uniref:Adapter protein MecA 1/2 n=1 Tax=Falsibacillus pallidus TaxID=493781 RepID=A0A370GGQ0_9BACI|nr:adaptor protein MecA [Falsibacillus pallidus]RDI42965.1 adapter protein MecA 1/2 [Falsibacillus pallidus]
MKSERLSTNKIKFSITFDELSDKGFLKDELWKESLIWHELFDEMLEEAKNQYDLELAGAVSVEIFSLTSKEIVLILTLDAFDEDYYEEWSDDEEYEDESDDLEEEETDETAVRPITFIYSFPTIEEIISYGIRIQPKNVWKSSVYLHNESYYLLLEGISPSDAEMARALCEEYGCVSRLTSVYLNEYGKPIILNEAIQILKHHFK